MRAAELVGDTLTDPGEIVDAATAVLGITDQLNANERNGFIDYLTSEVGGPLDLTDPDFVDRKLSGLFGLLLQSPAYQVH